MSELCAICLESTESTEGESTFSTFTLKCNHKFHYQCLKMLISINCPLCRKVPENLPKELFDLILKNKKKSIKEDQLEEIQNEIERYHLQRLIDENILILKTAIEESLQYLIQNKIPLKFIPNLNFLNDQPPQLIKDIIISKTILAYQTETGDIDNYENDNYENDNYEIEIDY